jgi:hypothetical protein
MFLHSCTTSKHTSDLLVSAHEHHFLDLGSVLFLLIFHGEQISKFGSVLASSVSACLSPVPEFDYGHQVLCPVKGKGPILLTVRSSCHLRTKCDKSVVINVNMA